ncbi:MAG TPA: hypothetical protein VH592_04630 [Gemmataceae bacterium]|jgi:hypothetical protein
MNKLATKRNARGAMVEFQKVVPVMQKSVDSYTGVLIEPSSDSTKN